MKTFVSFMILALILTLLVCGIVDAQRSSWNQGDLKMQKFSIDGDKDEGIYFDPDADSVNEIQFSADGNIILSGSLSLSKTMTISNPVSLTGNVYYATIKDDGTVGKSDVLFGTEANDGGTSPGGSDTQVQFNDGGSFGGDDGLTWNKTTNDLSIQGSLSLSDNITLSSATSLTGTQYFATIDANGMVGRSNLPYPIADGSGDAAIWSDDGNTLTTVGTDRAVSISGNLTISGVKFAPYAKQWLDMSLNATQSTPATGQEIELIERASHNFPFNDSTNQATLTGGVTYRLSSAFNVYFANNDGRCDTAWYDVTNGIEILSRSIQFSIPDSDQQSNNPVTGGTYTPATDCLVELRIITATNGNAIDSRYGWAWIESIAPAD